MVAASAEWKKGALTTAAGVADAFAVGGVTLQPGMAIRLRGVLGTVGVNARREWIFVAERHPMHGDPLAEHLGESAAVLEGSSG